MASKKKEELLQPEVQTQAQPAAQSTYSAEGLNSRADVEKAMANVSYRPGQQVTDAADALKQWQQNRPADYQSSYQDKINSLLGQLLERENFQYSYTRDPLYRQYEQLYTQNAHNASADAAAQAAALTGGYGSSYATSAAQQAYQQQIGGLASAIPTLYSLALDTYQSGGEELVNRLEQLNGQEQNAQSLYDRQLQDYYTQLQQKGDAYNDAYAKDYGQYQEHLNRLDTPVSYTHLHWRYRHLLGPCGAWRAGRHCGAQRLPADALLGARRAGYSGLAGSVPPQFRGHCPADCAVPAADGARRRGGGRAPVHPRGRPDHRQQERGGGLVL